MGAHVFQSSCGKGYLNILRVCSYLRLRQFRVEVNGHQNLRPTGTPFDGRNNVLYGRGVVGGDVSPHDMPLMPFYFQMEAENVWAVETEHLKGEVLRLVVEYGNDAVMRAWRLGRCDLVPSQLSSVTTPPTPPRDLHILKEAKVDVNLVHYVQQLLESAIPAVTDILQNITNFTERLPPVALFPTCRKSRNPEKILHPKLVSPSPPLLNPLSLRPALLYLSLPLCTTVSLYLYRTCSPLPPPTSCTCHD